MPYIDPKRREILDPDIDSLFCYIQNKGDVNYCITRLVHLWIMKKTKHTVKSYAVLSEGHSVLQDAAAEYYNTIMVPHEVKKKLKNGPVSDLDGGKL